MSVLDNCPQLHGGYGNMTEYPISRMWSKHSRTSTRNYSLSTVMWTTPARRAYNPGLKATDLQESPPRKARALGGISRRGRRRGTGRRCLVTPGGGRCRDTRRRFPATGRRTCTAPRSR
jgi:hypothetical protein